MTCLGLLVFFICNPQPATAADAPYCTIAKPIFWDPADTRSTKEQADRENRKFKRLCQVASR